MGAGDGGPATEARRATAIFAFGSDCRKGLSQMAEGCDSSTSQGHGDVAAVGNSTARAALGEIGPEGLSQSEVVGSHRQILSGWRWKVVGHSLVEFLQGKVAVSYDPQAGIPKFTAASEE